MIANGNGKIATTPPPTAPAASGECLGSSSGGGVPWESSHSSEGSAGNTGTVKRRPNSLESKEKTPSPTACGGVEISSRKERFQEDGKNGGQREECGTTKSEHGTGGVWQGSKKSSIQSTAGPGTIKSSTVGEDDPKASSHTVVERRKTLVESKFTGTKATRLDESRLKSKLKSPGVLQRASTMASSGKADPKSGTMKGGAAGGGTKEKKVSSPPGATDMGGSGARAQKKVSFIPSLSVNVAATSVAPGGNVRTSAVKTILRTRAQQSQTQPPADGSVEYKELFRDYPPPAPPYRDPPPVPASTNTGTTLRRSDPKQILPDEQQIAVEPTKGDDVGAVVRSKLKGFGLGKLISSHAGQERRNTNNYVTLPPSPKASSRVTSSRGLSGGDLPALPTHQTPSIAYGEKPRQPSPDDILTKPEFSSSQFKNIPVRQKKGTVPHLENYCLFDPSVDFFNEKEHKMRAIPETVELADQVLYQDHLIYDAVVDRDSDNYFTIEPESLEIEVKNRLSLERVEEKIDEIFSKTRTGSHSSTGSSTSGSSPDYPSMFNSVIETPSSNLESTDESDYGFRNRLMENLKVLAVPKSISGSIPDEGAEGQEEQQMEDDVLNGGESNEAAGGGDAAGCRTMRQSPPSPSVYYGVVLKAGSALSRLERVHQQQSMSVPNSPLLQHRLQQQQQAMKQQHRKCDDSSSSSSSANASPPAASSAQSEGTNTSRTLMRQNTFTCSGTATPVHENIGNSASLQTQGTPKAINASPSPSLNVGEGEEKHQQKVTKIKPESNNAVGAGATGSGGKVANLLPLLRSTFALDPLKSSFSLPQLPTGACSANHRAGLGGVAVSATGAISKTQPAVVTSANGHQHRNGSLDSTPLFNRLRKRERPLSNHSDADSGFLSPATPPDSNGATILAAVTNEEVAKASSTTNSDAVVLEQCDSIQELIQIYTDWANYYLERAKSKKKVSDLSADCRDGLLLAEVIEAVTTFKVPDLVKKPKTPQHMYDNVNSCLTVLRQHQVGGLESVTPNDICSGRLKAVLSLFFALSRYKQATKQKSSLQLQPPQQLHQQQQQQQTKVEIHAVPAEMTNRQLPVPYAKAGVNGGTAIPLPATVLVTRRCPPDKVRPLPPTPNQQTGLHGGLQKHTLGSVGGGVSTSTPSDGNSCPGSPQHNGTAIITQIPKGNNSLRLPQATNCKIPASPYAASTANAATLQHNNHHNNNNNNTITLIPNGNVTNIPTNPAQHQKHSMLDKFKLFNSKEKQDRAAQKSQISKRTSSSSGFSSARSERSDSSLSLDNGHHQSTATTMVIPGAKVKESGLKKLDSATKSSSSSVAVPSTAKSSSKLISSKSSSKEAAKAAAKAEKLQRNSKDPGAQDPTGPQTHIPLAPQKAQKIPMATTVMTTSMAAASSPGASAMASKVAAADSARLKLASVGSGGRKLDTKSESKTSLLQHHQLQQQQVGTQMMMVSQSHIQSPKSVVQSQQQQQQQQQQQMQQMQQMQQQQQSAVNTGIPKPMAAVKGTSKPSQQLLSPACGTKEDGVVCLKGTVPGAAPNNNNANGGPISVSGNNNTTMGQLQQQQQATTNSGGNSMSDSMHSNSTQGASMGQHSNSSETSSVVAYRPSSESGSEQLLHSPQKLVPSNGGSVALLYAGQPDVNLNSSSSNGSASPAAQNGVFHNGHNHNLNNNNINHLSKFNTVPTKILNTANGAVGGPTTTTIYEQEEKQITVLPMRPLLRGYNSHVTLPTRGTRGHHPHHPHVSQQHLPQHHQLMAADYCEDYGGLGGGYCSDGDALRKIPARYSDNIDNGYLSEGGGGGGSGASMLTGNGRQQHASYISSLRARTQLPTTIEERCRSSRGDHLDSVGTNPPAMEHSHVNGKSSSSSSARHSSGSSIGPNGREYWGKLPDPSGGHGSSNGGSNSQHSSQPPSPTVSRKDKTGSSPGQSRRSTPSSKGASGRAKSGGVPQSFGYIKRTNGGSSMPGVDPHQQQQQLQQQQQQQHGQQGQNLLTGGRTAHVSAVPRSSKLKVSGGTQTTTADFQAKVQQHPQYRSFSLTGPGAAQLSQSVKERFGSGTHSLPKPGLDMHVFQHRMSNRASAKLTDGSLSDTQTYAEVKPDYGSYAMWLKHSNTASSRLSEGDTLDAISMGTSPAAAVAAVTGSPGSVTRPHKLLHHTRGETQQPHHHHHHHSNTTTATNSPRLNRSNSIRSTKSEKMYPSMLSRGPDVDIEPYYCLPVGTVVHPGNGMVPWSQPTSPTPPARGFGGLLSPTHTNAGNAGGRLTYPKKNDEVHGSQASLLSGGSSLYGSTEERQAGEVRRLKRELIDARDQVMSLSSQLSTNAHVVAAFEQSLSNMTHRLQSLTATTEKKDSEILEMRQTIELLRKQSIQAGLTTAHMQSMGVQVNGQVNGTATATEQTKTTTTTATANATANANANAGSNNGTTPATGQTGGAEMQRHHSSDSMCSLNSVSSGCSAQDKNKKKKGWLRSSFTKAFSRNAKISKTNRHVTAGSGGVGGGGQPTSTTDGNGSHHHHHHHHHHHPGSTVENGTTTTANTTGTGPLNGGGLKQTGIPGVPPVAGLPPPSPTKGSPHKTMTVIENAKPVDAIELNGNPMVEDLKKQLREKDLVLTDIRLEALSSASQLESLKDTVMKMRQEMMNLKHNNERLQRLVTTRSLAGSEVSLGPVSPSGSIGEPRRYSLAADNGMGRAPLELPQNLDETEEDNIPPAPAPEPPPAPLSPAIIAELSPTIERAAMVNEILTTPAEDVADPVDGKKISIAVYLGQPESFPKYAEEMNECDNYFHSSPDDETDGDKLEGGEKGPKSSSFSVGSGVETNEFVIAYTYISGKTTWQNLDYIVRKTFKDYLSRIDPGTNLGLNTDSITSYHLGEAKRGPEMGFPELLPCGYIIGNVKTLYICLQGVGSLAFDSLILRNIVHRYISLLTEHRRLILCGPSGTGKSYLARKLAEFLVARAGRDNPIEAIATFNVDHKSSKELQQYLGHIAEQASMSNGAAEELPAVIILDNLHHASALGDVFSCLLSATAAKLPCIIGTMSQATCNTTNLQLHHNFRWVLTANHMEPVKGFLGRFLRRKLFTVELQHQQQQPQLEKVLKWLPTVWQHINSFLETHSSSDVTIGPRLFLSCPMNLPDSQVWFTDVWNYHLAPYLMEAVREGVQLYGRRGGAWVDPCTYIRETYPWPIGPTTVPQLRQITADDVGLEASAPGNSENQDPLLNMLMRLQEAANYNGNTEQDSDCASLDSNMTHDSSAGAE